MQTRPPGECSDTPLTNFHVRKLGVIMLPQAGNEDESEGVLNPAAVRGRDGSLYLFPRVVGRGNFSRIGIARVVFDAAGDAVAVERLGYALEPAADYECVGSDGGCEDARVIFFAPLDLYVMTYTALGPSGPRIAIAISRDALLWERRGLVRFDDSDERYCNPIGNYHNKDGAIFPHAVPGPDGRLSLALLHRPVYDNSAEPGCYVPCGVADPRACIWISYCAMDDLDDQVCGGLSVKGHELLAAPEWDWENLRIGAGGPPVRTGDGWLLIYHGVSVARSDAEMPGRTYRAGVMLLDPVDPRRILARSILPILSPESEDERHGIVSNVVFPTGVDIRYDLNATNRMDIYYGMADARIGAAVLTWEQDETKASL